MKPRRGKTIALACGLGVAAVLGAGIVFRKDIAAAWHLHRLRTDETCLPRILEAPEDSAADLAVRRWAEMPEGRQAVFIVCPCELQRATRPTRSRTPSRASPGDQGISSGRGSRDPEGFLKK